MSWEEFHNHKHFLLQHMLVWVQAWIYVSVHCTCWLHVVGGVLPLQLCTATSWHNRTHCPLKPDLLGAPYACIPPQPRCFSLGPLTVSTTLMPSHGASYERYVVCKLLSTSTLDITLRHNMSPLSSSLSHTHAEGWITDVNHVFLEIISRVRGAAE